MKLSVTTLFENGVAQEEKKFPEVRSEENEESLCISPSLKNMKLFSLFKPMIWGFLSCNIISQILMKLALMD